MSNTAWFIPTKNTEHYHIRGIKELLEKEFPLFKVRTSSKSLQIENENGTINAFWFSRCDFLNTLDEDEKWVTEDYRKSEFKNKLLAGIKQLRFMNFDKTKVYLSCGYYATFENEKNKALVERFIHQYFGCFWLDEGIHPEFIGPEYQFKPLDKNKDYKTKF
jgi:hypothetical protein